MDETDQKTYHDRLGTSFTVVGCGPGDFLRVLDMYDSFMPEAVAQGLPPTDKATRHTWIRTLLETGENYAAMIEGKVVGHAALLPNRETNDGEYVIFVGGPHRKRGLAYGSDRNGNSTGQSAWLAVRLANCRVGQL